MSQTSDLLKTLKKCLKAKGISYRQLAEEMQLSETSIKRLFSQESFSLKRIEAICNILELDIFDLALMTKNEHDKKEDKLTIEQESTLADDPSLLTFFYFLLIGFPLSLIKKKYAVSDQAALKYLIQLDKLKLIELHPDNKIKFLVTQKIFWRKYGPIWERFQDRIREDFYDHIFDQPDCFIDFCPGQLSKASVKLIIKKLNALVQQFNQLAEMDSHLPLKQRQNTALHIGFRPWIFTMKTDRERDLW